MALTKLNTHGIGTDVILAEDIAANAVTIAELGDQAVSEAKMQISNAGTNGQFLSKQSGNTGGLTWADAGIGATSAITTSGNVTLTGTVKTPYIAVNNDIYTCSGTLKFNGAYINSGYYQGFDLQHAQRYYGNLHTDAIATYKPSNSVISYGGTAIMPTSANVSTWISNKNLFNVWCGIQFWRVPKSATYTIRCKGAGRAVNYDGKGRDIQADFSLNAGEWLRIICGARGKGDGNNHCGGHGASAVAVVRHGIVQPLIVAGGGSGISANSTNSELTTRHARAPDTTTAGAEAHTLSGGDKFVHRGGIGGIGSLYLYTYDTYLSQWPGGGGGGWFTPGGGGGIGKNLHHPLGGGGALSSMPHGGHFHQDDTGWVGGFGGGGYTGTSGGSAGGGGGWDGGHATYNKADDSGHGTAVTGGGSWLAEVTNATDHGAHTGHGEVWITVPS